MRVGAICTARSGGLAVGHIEALETIWNESARPLHAYAFALTADHDEADGILSEVAGKPLRSG